MSNKFIKENVNTKFFDFPCNKIKSKFYALKYHLNSMKISASTSDLFICNKTSNFDKYFLNESMEGFFVVLKDEVIQKIYNQTITYEEESELFSSIEALKDLLIPIVVFPEKSVSVFGDSQELPDEIIEFLLRFEMNISFLYLIGSYFINPVWTNKNRVCETKTEHKFTIKYEEQKSLPYEEIKAKINKCMPSSASVYAQKNPIYLRTNKCAEDLEKILYNCPKCNRFFTLLSEFNAVKCNNCGTAFELSRINSEISLTKSFSNLEGAKIFQFSFLETQDFIYDKLIISYDDLNFITKSDKKQTIQKCNLSIYSNKIEYKLENKVTTLNFYEVFDIYLSYNNTIVIYAYDFDKKIDYYLYIQGTKKENLYILTDLLKIYEKKQTSNE